MDRVLQDEGVIQDGEVLQDGWLSRGMKRV